MRVFTAVVPPAEVIDQVRALHGVTGIERWERYPHITLSYFGEVTASVMSALSHALESVRFKPFRLSPTHIGTFGDRERQVVWIGFEPSPELEALNAQIAELSTQLIGRPDRLDFVPHMTLARTVGVEPRAVDELIARAEAHLPGGFDVTSFDLLESTTNGYELRCRVGS